MTALILGLVLFLGIHSARIVADGTPAELLAKSPTKRLDDVFRALTTADAEIKVESAS